MGRYRDRSRSYSPRRSRTPPPRRRYDEPRDYRDRRSVRDRRSPAPSGLLVRNISLDARPEDLRIPFERFGPVKDVYLPKNYYTGEPRGFGFVKFRNADDAAEAKHHLNHTVIGGREIAIVFAAENRKTPQEMRRTGRTSGRYGGSSKRRSPPRSPRRRYHSYSPSPTPPRHASSGRDHRARDYYSPSRSRSVSRSLSPRDNVYRSTRKSMSPRRNDRSPFDPRDHRGSDKRIPSSRRNDRSPFDLRDRGSHERSPSPRRNDRSPFDPRHHGSDQRSPSPRSIDCSPRDDDRVVHDKKDHGFDRRSPDVRDNAQSLSRSPSRSHYQSRSRSYSPR